MTGVAMITGGLGFIGSAVARVLLEEARVDRVVCLDHFGRYLSSLEPDFIDYRKYRLQGLHDQLIIERAEARYPLVLARLLDRHRPRLVFHLASLPLAQLDNLGVEEAIDGSVRATANLLESCRDLRQRSGHVVERVLYTSSSMVYGDFESPLVDEEHPTRPINVYGSAKLAGEVVTRGLSRAFDIPCTIVRPSAVYGPTDMNRRVIQKFIERAIAGLPLVVEGADEALDFTYVDDVAKGLVLAATCESAVNETFNITAGRARTLREVVEILRLSFPDLRVELRPRDDGRPRRGTLSIDKAQRLLGYHPAVHLEQGLAHCVEFLRMHYPGRGTGTP